MNAHLSDRRPDTVAGPAVHVVVAGPTICDNLQGLPETAGLHPAAEAGELPPR